MKDLKIDIAHVNNQGILFLEGKFNYHSHKHFRETYDKIFDNHSVKKIEINFEKVPYIDSSALGMLLMLKEKCAEHHVELYLSKVPPSVMQVFVVASFDKLFNILQ